MSTDLLAIYCPACDRQHIESLMRKTRHGRGDGMLVTCTGAAQHRFDYTRLMALNPRKQQLQFNEKQPGNTIAQPFWIYPEVLQALRERWPGNMMTTVCSILSSLADGSTFIVEGEYARELAQAKPPITKGREVAGMLHTIDQLKTQIVNLEDQLKSRPKQAVGQVSDPRLDAILAALANSGIQVPVLPQQPASSQPNLATSLDYIEGDPDIYVDPNPPLETDEPTVRGIPRPVTNYR